MSLSLDRYSYAGPIREILRKRIERHRKRYAEVLVEVAGDCIIPEDLIVDIFSRLPVRTLLQFKTVCKSWYAIINSSEFISKHLQNYYDNDKNWRDCVIIQYVLAHSLEVSYNCAFLVDDKSRRFLSYQLFWTPAHNTHMCGPCHGLYYLWCINGPPRARALWNPALNEFEYLPELTPKPNLSWSYLRSKDIAYGFGFDHTTNDYKVVVIQSYNDTRYEYSSIHYPLSLFIYTLKSNSWRYWGDLKNSCGRGLERSKAYVLVNECYHWLEQRQAYYSNYVGIISFDLSAETCKEIALPDSDDDDKPGYGSQLIVYHDSIALVSFPAGCHHNNKFSIWTWDDEVWTRKLTMELEFGVYEISQCWDNMIVFNTSRKPMLCDTSTKEVWELGSRPSKELCEKILVFKESLVSFKDFIPKPKHEEDVTDVDEHKMSEVEQGEKSAWILEVRELIRLAADGVTPEVPDWFWPDN